MFEEKWPGDGIAFGEAIVEGEEGGGSGGAGAEGGRGACEGLKRGVVEEGVALFEPEKVVLKFGAGFGWV